MSSGTSLNLGGLFVSKPVVGFISIIGTLPLTNIKVSFNDPVRTILIDLPLESVNSNEPEPGIMVTFLAI